MVDLRKKESENAVGTVEFEGLRLFLRSPADAAVSYPSRRNELLELGEETTGE